MAENAEQEGPQGQVENSRRRFLKTAGKIAVYTPPAMMLMSNPSFATFSKSGGHTYPKKHFSFRRGKKFSFKRSYGSRKKGR